MKKLCAFLLLAAVLFSLTACTSKTPDVVASENAVSVTLDNVDWTLEIEGADVTSYTLADAQKHELSHMISDCNVSYDGSGGNGNDWIHSSFRVDGINLFELLEDVGRADATKVTYYGKDLYGTEFTFVIEGDLLQSEDVKIGWIRNKTEVLFDTDTYVGVFGASTLAQFTTCCCVSKLVIE